MLSQSDKVNLLLVDRERSFVIQGQMKVIDQRCVKGPSD